MDPEISVIMLCYGASQRIYAFVDKTMELLKSNIPSWEIILVGNYFENTKDEIPGIVRDIASRNADVKACTLPKEGMMGWDARKGMEKANGRYICLIDGDEQMPPGDIIGVYRKIKNENLDLVKTYRAERYDNLIRKSISYVYNCVFRLLFPGILVRDVNSKPKIFTRETYRKMCLESNDWFLDAEIIIKARRLKLRTGEIPTKFFKCNYRRSFVKIGAISEFIKNLVYIRIKEYFK